MRGENPGIEPGPIWSGLTYSVVVAPGSWRRTITILDNAVPKSMHAVQFSSNLASSMLRSSSSVDAGAERGVDGAEAGRVADRRPNRLRKIPFLFSLMTPTLFRSAAIRPARHQPRATRAYLLHGLGKLSA